ATVCLRCRRVSYRGGNPHKDRADMTSVNTQRRLRCTIGDTASGRLSDGHRRDTMEGAKARAYIGTSGWSYDAWRDSHYHGRPQSEWLSLCAQRFSAIEVDATFYRLQRRETFQRWRAGTPADFRFAIKANRYLTHS